jgi:hypothetical protein
MNCGLSAAWSTVRMNASGRHFRSAARSSWLSAARTLVCAARTATFAWVFARTHVRGPLSAGASCLDAAGAAVDRASWLGLGVARALCTPPPPEPFCRRGRYLVPRVSAAVGRITWRGLAVTP